MKKRIAMISEHASPLTAAGRVDAGGQNIYVGQMARHLSRMGNQVDVFTRRADGGPIVVDWEDGVRIINVPAGPPTEMKKERLLPCMSEFASNMIDYTHGSGVRYDVVQANFWMSGLVAAGLKNALGIPFAVTFHALGKIRRRHQKEADESPEIREELERNVALAADAVIAECPQDREDLIRLYGVPPDRIANIACGFDPSEFEPTDKGFARALIGLPPREPLLLQLGRMVPRKGVDTAIRAVARLRSRHGRSVRMAIVGGELEGDSADAAEIRRLRAVAREENVADLILFRGRADRDQLRYFYAAADAFVTVPWYEPFGITPLEAMACGTPVIGADVGGIKHSIRHGETGFLVPPRNPDAVADRLNELYSHPERLRVFGRKAVERVNALFTWSSVADEMDDLLSDIVERKATPLRTRPARPFYATRTAAGLPYLGLDRRRMERVAS